MKIKITFGSNAASQGSLTSTFCYVSTAENGVVNVGAHGAPQKVSSNEILNIVDQNEDKIIALFNFEKILQNENVVATANAQGISDFPQSLYSMSIYKKEIWYDRQKKQGDEQPLWEPVALNSYANTLRDFNIANNRQYKYVFRLTEHHAAGTQENVDGILVPLSTHWSGWSITELHPTANTNVYNASPKDVWKFKYNISTGDQTQNVSKTEQKTLGAFSVFSHGQQNAISGTVQCLMGREIINANYVDDEYVYQFNEMTQQWEWQSRHSISANIGGYIESLNRYNNSCDTGSQYQTATALGFRDLSSNEAVDMLNQWRQVCYSGNPKLLKDQKGQKFLIQIFNPSNTINENWDHSPVSISFSWMQIQSADDVQIIQEETN